MLLIVSISLLTRIDRSSRMAERRIDFGLFGRERLAFVA